MKLKCDKHNLRIHALNGKFIHRGSSTNFPCNSPTASFGDTTYTASDIQKLNFIELPQSAL